jgi:hypothetical protein
MEHTISYWTVLQYWILWNLVYLIIRETLIAHTTSMTAMTAASSKNKLAAAIVSQISTIIFIYSGDRTSLVCYYIYDLLHHLLNKNTLYIAHHLASIVMILPTITDSFASRQDIEKIILCCYVLKFTDLFVHVPKIIYESEFSAKQSIWSRRMTILCYVLSLCLWVPFRCVFPFYMYPFDNMALQIVAIGIHCGNIVWTIKMFEKLVNLVFS